MSHFPFFDRPGRYRGSSLLLSAGRRMRRAALAVLFLWLLTGWALGWW
ncbi:putative protein OS=Castellaniella defragrans (strain DSM / CCUG 39792 / 65Phen) OX=1437824 GN=BN940_02246 PE=4 SV=1 [Castellaniella denitrificans]|nr:hypothetical protein [Castellaniella sp.]